MYEKVHARQNNAVFLSARRHHKKPIKIKACEKGESFDAHE